MVIQLMEAAEAEIEAAVNEAYAEGYKAGLLSSLPDAVYYKALSESLEDRLDSERQKLPGWVNFAFGFTGGLLSLFLLSR